MDRTGSELLCGKVAEWFPLLPRGRPPCRALPCRVDEIRELARSASYGANDARISLAAEAHNKAALILSDCGLADLAQQLCWRQFDIFRAATPLTAKTAKIALQPIVNLGRPNKALHDVVKAGLEKKWPPQQISKRLREDFPGDDTMRLIHSP
ncbi:MAG: hypothetical protein ACRDRP_20235 [Pseudonocardiaceae bacterium]